MPRKLNLMMSPIVVIAIGCITLVFGQTGIASAQRYGLPIYNNYMKAFTPPTIDSYTRSMNYNRLNAGYSGLNAPLDKTMPGLGSSSGRLDLGLGASSSRGSKPFSSYSSQPTVSPYLNLFRTDLGGGGNFNYSTLVQPQLQQQQVNQQLERQSMQANRKIQAMAAQPAFNPEGSKDEYPTGHQTVFNNWSHYYQAPQVQKKRR